MRHPKCWLGQFRYTCPQGHMGHFEWPQSPSLGEGPTGLLPSKFTSISTSQYKWKTLVWGSSPGVGVRRFGWEQESVSHISVTLHLRLGVSLGNLLLLSSQGWSWVAARAEPPVSYTSQRLALCLIFLPKSQPGPICLVRYQQTPWWTFSVSTLLVMQVRAYEPCDAAICTLSPPLSACEFPTPILANYHRPGFWKTSVTNQPWRTTSESLGSGLGIATTLLRAVVTLSTEWR